METTTYDVVVIGGGVAGLSGALALARARRRVLVIDAGEPRNAPADRVHNYLGREGTPPHELLAIGRAEVESYGGEVRRGTATGAKADGPGFLVTVDRSTGDWAAGGGGTGGGAGAGSTVRARRLLVTTGTVDTLPDLPGLAERWGRTVLHCPYCHGWEVRDQAIGVLGGPAGAHQALLWRQWSPDVTLFGTPDEADRPRLAARGVRVVEEPVAGVEGGADVRLATGELVPRDALVVRTVLAARSAVLADLGLEPVEREANGMSFGTAVPAGPTGATTVPGVYVAGNLAEPMAVVAVAVASGLMAGSMLNADLVEDDVRLALA